MTTTVFTVKVIYKNGVSMEFDVTKYEIDKDGTHSWERYKNNPTRPMFMNVNEVMAVWIVNEYEVEDQ